ncbi:MAG: AAA family ATPase [Paludibacteraceae bacterium]|nr:AAA family ATPase [Paludibacteraceae bacterium]
MKEGDIVASCYSENEVDAIGIVTGGYEYNKDFGDYPRYRKVHWLVKNIRENILAVNDNKKFTLSTVYRSNITAEDALKIVEKHSKSNSSPTNHTASNSSIESKTISLNKSVIDDAIEAFKKDVRKTGDVGVTVQSIRKQTTFFKVTVNEKGTIFVTNTKGSTVAASPTEIEDYVKTGNYDEGHATYEPGIGQYIIDHYMSRVGIDHSAEESNPTTSNNAGNKPFVFIIDEINRGEISKIFGELFFSIDPGYRGEKGIVQTQYQNMVEGGDAFKKGFYVPENVYIIGTMNDIDRSVESMDFAFRRRFAFKEIKAIDRVEMLYDAETGIGEYAEKAKNRMIHLNEEIEKIEGLSSAYHVGPAYFLKLKNYNGDFSLLWKYHLEGLLREYLRGMQDIKGKIEVLNDAYNNDND